MVKIIGKKEEAGRPLLYGTTKEFLAFFSLKSLTSLPTLREFRELSEENRTIVEKETQAPEPVLGLSDLADSALTNKLAESAAESADAMADLEAAMEEAEARAKKLSAELSPPAPAQDSAELLN